MSSMALNRRIIPDRRKRQVRKKRLSAVPAKFFSNEVFAEGPDLKRGIYYPGIISLGRRKWKNQLRWPKDLERRRYNSNRVTVIASGNKIATTRRKVVSDGRNLIEVGRRADKKLAKQIEKVSKKEQEEHKRS